VTSEDSIIRMNDRKVTSQVLTESSNQNEWYNSDEPSTYRVQQSEWM